MALGAQVIKYESVIHEFDPYFNFRVTQVWLLVPFTSLFRFVLEYVELSSVIGYYVDVLILSFSVERVLGFGN
jgi:hypothetical protein